MPKKAAPREGLVLNDLKKHFGDWSIPELVTAHRSFPVTARVDLQTALESMMSDGFEARLIGLHRDYNYQKIRFSDFLDTERNPLMVGPLQYSEIDTGTDFPARCLDGALWFCRKDLPFVVILAMGESHSDRDEVTMQIAVPPGEAGMRLSQEVLARIEQMVAEAGSYRGKVISLEQTSSYSGSAGAIRVHKLRTVQRDEVILPPATLQMLERNVTGFIEQRQRLKELGMPVKKGLLFYGPPGTGKTHTIHYLASQLPEHTTLLVTAGQVGLLHEYFSLARFLQPAMLVIEDVDLIARDRQTMRDGCEEVLLNRLLNEMDGLREDASILFVLTTNHPEVLEAALASRPGRVDQAIEFPMPDAEGRRKLVKLYSRGLDLDSELSEWVVERTEGASPAFIKELLRKTAQYFLSAATGTVTQKHAEQALEDILMGGGKLNVKILGGSVNPGCDAV
jgi:hypothetical protein